MIKKILFALVLIIGFLSGYLFNGYLNNIEKANFPSLKQNVVSSKPIDKRSSQLEEKFSDEDLKTFKLIKSFYKDFEYSDKYTITSEDEKKMIFNKEKENNLYFGSYISYDVIYSYGRIVNYAFDAGTMSRGYGTYYVVDDDTVINVEKSSGTSAYSYEISKNGVILDTKTQECDQFGNPIK